MTNKKRLVPQLRFRGFTDDWEQRKASHIFKSVSSKGHPQLPVLSASQEDGMVLRDKIGIDIKYDQKSLAGYKLVLPGQFVIHLRSFQGGFAYSAVEGITSPAYTIIDFLDKSQNISEFWEELLKSTSFIASLVTVTYGIRDGRSISFSDFGNLKLNYPSSKEQDRIAEFLQILERAIALHQRKHELLLKLKQAYLQKLFPKNGNKIPELRFAGFTDDWEQRKFSELFQKSSEKNTNLSFSRSQVLTGATMTDSDREINSDDDYMKTYNVIHVGDILFEGHTSKQFAFGRFVLDDYRDGIVSHVFDIYRPKEKMNLGFWKYYIHDENVMRPVLVNATSNARMLNALSSSEFLKQSVYVPDDNEQAKIGKMLEQIDRTIDLHQERLDQLKQLKKAYLQKLFV